MAAGEEKVVNVFEFFELMDAILLCPKCIVAPKVYKCDIWTKFRVVCNRMLKLDKLSVDIRFDIFILTAVLISVTALILSEAKVGNEEILFWIDEVIKWIFTFEVMVKLIGLGIEKYFGDNWNRFDFTLVLLTFFEAGISSLRLIKALKAGRLARLSKLGRTQKILKQWKWCKSLVVFRFCTFCTSAF